MLLTTGKIIIWLVSWVVCSFFVFGAIARKAGYPRWYGIGMTVPLVNVFVLFWFAFATWPIEYKLLELQLQDTPARSVINH